MSWITAIWSATVGASLVMGLVYLLVWSRNRRSWANLCFFFTVIGVLGLAVGEMATMHAESPEVFGRAIRWTHFVYAIGFVGSLGFIHFYFGTGRRWLLALAIGLRLLVVLANFTTGVNTHFTVIHSLQKITFLGEQVSVLGEWVPVRGCGLRCCLRWCSLSMWWMPPSGCGARVRADREVARWFWAERWRFSSSSPWGSPGSSRRACCGCPSS